MSIINLNNIFFITTLNKNEKDFNEILFNYSQS